MSGYVPHQRCIGDCLQFPAQAPRLRGIFGPLASHFTPGYSSRSLFTHLPHQFGARDHALGASAIASSSPTNNGRRRPKRGVKVDRTASHVYQSSQPGATIDSLTQQNAPQAALDKSGGASPCTNGGTPTQAQDAESAHGGQLQQRKQESPVHLRQVKTPQSRGGVWRRPSGPSVARDTHGAQNESDEAAQQPTGPGRQLASSASSASGKGGGGGKGSDSGEGGGSGVVGKGHIGSNGPSEACVGGSSPKPATAAQRQNVSRRATLDSASAQASGRVAASEDSARRSVGETSAPKQSKDARRVREGAAAGDGDGATGQEGGGGRSAGESGRVTDAGRSGEAGRAGQDSRRGLGSDSAGGNPRHVPEGGEQSNGGDSGTNGEPPTKRRRGLDNSAAICGVVRRRQSRDAVSSCNGEGSGSGSSSGSGNGEGSGSGSGSGNGEGSGSGNGEGSGSGTNRSGGGGSNSSGGSQPARVLGERHTGPNAKFPGDSGAGASSRAAGTTTGGGASSQAYSHEPPHRTQTWGSNAGRAAPARIGQPLRNHRPTNNGRIHSGPRGSSTGGGRVDPRAGPPSVRPPFRPGAAGAGARDRTAVGGAAPACRPAQNENIWMVTVEPIKMGEDYPEMADFVAAVRERAASWHPLHISAAMNHMAKMWDPWSKQKPPPPPPPPPHGAAVTATAGRKAATAGVQAPPDASTAGDGAAVIIGAATTASVAGGGPDATPEKTLQETMDVLHAAFLPHIRAINNSRYAMNALWVCAKTGYWGAPESTVVPAILQRLRQDSYAIISRSNGQAHGNLWWALSQYDQQMGEAPTRTRSFWTSAVPSPGRGSTEGTPGSAAMRGGGGGGNRAEKSAAAGVAARRRGGSSGGRVTAGEDGGGSPDRAAGAADGKLDSDRAATAMGLVTVPAAAAAGDRAAAAAAVSAPAPTAPVAGGMDILKASASVILSQASLSEESFKPQEFSNIILAAARLGYSTNPRFIAHLLTHMVKHPGPFKPQAISNTIYALSELYGDEVTSGTHVSEVVEEEDAAQGPAAGGAAKDAAGRLPPGLGTHLRALAGLALRMGLHQFNPQELSNMVYGMARLGFKMDSRPFGMERSGEWEEEEEEANEAAVQLPAALSPLASPSPAPESAGPRSTAHGTQLPDPEQRPRQEGVGEEHKHEQLEQEQEAGDQRPSAAAFSSASINVLGQEDSVGAPMPLRANDTGIRHFVCRVAEHFRERLQGFLKGSLPPRMAPIESMSISLTSWSLASIGYVDQSYYATIVQAALQGGLMDCATPQEWGLYLWALGNHGHQPPRELVRRLYTGTSRLTPAAGDTDGWIMMPWALAVLDLYDEAIVSWVCGILSCARVDALEPQGLANCLWSLAAMPEGALARHAELTAALVESANRRRPQDFRLIGRVQLWQVHIELEAIINSQLSTTDRGDPTAGCTATPPQQQTAKRRGRRPCKGDARELTRGSGAVPEAASAAAFTSDHAPVQQQQQQKQPRAVTLPRLSAALVAAGFEALMKLNRRHSENKRTVLQTSVYRHLRAMMLKQAAQPQLQDGWRLRRRRSTRPGSASASASLDEDAPDDEDATPAPAAADSAVCGRVMRRGSPSAAAGSRGTNGTRDVGGRRRRNPVVICRIEQEWLVEPLGIRVDLCVWLSDGRQVVVEVDGPSHFFRNQPQTPLPNTTLRNRQLSRVFGQGNILTVPYFDWDAAGSPNIRTAYLARLLGLQHNTYRA